MLPIPIRSLLLLFSLVAPAACSSASSTEPSTTPGSGSTTTGAGAPSAVPRGADFVSAGNRSASGARTAVSSLGQSPGGNGVSRSSKYQLVGGLVATTQP